MSPDTVKLALTQDLVFLFLALEQDHNSPATQDVLESNRDNLLDRLVSGLSISAPWTKSYDSQVTSLGRALLDYSGGKLNLRQHRLGIGYTCSHNADLYATMLDMTRTRRREFDAAEMYRTFSQSHVFSASPVGGKDLRGRAEEMTSALGLAFREGHLV